MSGRGTDTRMYSPRSESDKMYSSANEDETKYNPASPEYNEQKREEKNRKEEEKKERRSKVKHIKIRAAQKLNGEESPEGLDDGNKRDDDREMGLTGGPPGSRGTLLDLATGAKSGTGSAMSGPMPIAMSEPMEGAWSTLLKETRFENMYGEEGPGEHDLQSHQQGKYPFNYAIDGVKCRQCGKISDDPADMNIDGLCLNCKMEATSGPKHASEPMEYAWSSLLKMSEAEALDYYHPENVVERHMAKKRALSGHGHMRRGLSKKIRADAEYAGERNVMTGIPYYLRYAHESHPQLIRHRGMLPDYRTPTLPSTAEEKNKFADLRDVAQNVGLRPQTLYHRLAFANLMLPPGPFTETEPEPEPDIQDSLVPGMAFVNGQLVPDPRVKKSSPMDLAWRLLKYNNDEEYIDDEEYYSDLYDDWWDEDADFEHYDPTDDSEMEEEMRRYREMMAQDYDKTHLVEDAGPLTLDQRNRLAALGMKAFPKKTTPSKPYPPLDWRGREKLTSEPMEGAWSDVLKRDTPKSIERRRREEKRREFRPSTGQFKRPPGGMDPTGATMKRFRARMRGIKGGKKTGLMKPHLSVEMSHRGIATKQPMSKDPQKYTAYRGQSEARKILGNVRTPFSPHGRYGERSNYAGPTGAGRISGLLPGQKGMMRQPSLRPIRVKPPRPPMMPRMPRMPMPPMMPMPQSSVPSMPAPPSSIMMSEDEQVHSELLKARNIVRHYELLNLMRRLIAAKEKEAKKIKKYVQGGGSAFEDGHVPSHPAGVQQNEDEEEKNDGPTQNLETNSSRLGLDPAGYLTSKRGHMG